MIVIRKYSLAASALKITVCVRLRVCAVIRSMAHIMQTTGRDVRAAV